MSWYSASWSHREAIAVDNTDGSGLIDITCEIPAAWGFWDTVKSDGSDIRLCDADGATVLTHKLTGWNSTNRTGTIEITGYSAPTDDGVCLVWLYWGNAAASAAVGSFTVENAKVGKIDPICSVRPVFVVGGLQPGRTKPVDQFAKGSEEVVNLYLDVRPSLNRRCQKVNGSSLGEELDYVSLAVLSGSSNQAAMYDQSKIRFIHPGVVKISILGGTSGTDYTISMKAGTTEGRILNPRILLRVKDVTA